MIFVVLGSQKFQFNRLLEYLDEAVKSGVIKDEVFAQIGYSDYKPSNFKYSEFIDRDEYKEILHKSDIVICHGGTGVIVEACKKGKKVIAIGRLARYNEHVDDHQLQIIGQFSEAGMIIEAKEAKDIGDIINNIDSYELKPYESNQKIIIEYLKSFIENI